MFKIIKKYYHLVSMGRYSEFLMVFIPWDNFLLNFYRLKKAKKKYKQALNKKSPILKSDNINDYEFSIFSQNGEDGILDYIFEKIGTTNGKFVEIGCGHTQNNSLYMICKRNFQGLFLDGEKFNVKAFNNFNKKILKSDNIAVEAWVDTENVNGIISSYISEKTIDLLSIDIDGYDYWLWDAINCIEPRVVIMEYNASFGLKSLTLPYVEKFIVSDYPHGPKFSNWYHGASLKALSKLGLKKGYVLIGTDKNGVNCFFVKKDLALKYDLKPQDSDSIFKVHKTRTEGTYTKVPQSQEEQFERIKNFDFVEV